MIRLLHVLIVEDSENDLKLLLEELRRGGYEAVHERVQNSAELIAALDRHAWDVVLSDYVSPQFSGPEALKLLREKGLDVPFIVISATYGEEAAVDMMKAGASDYIVKNNLSRLVPAIERELEVAQTRRARAQAEAALQFLAAIVESTEDAIYGKALDGTIISWNKAAERIFGYTAGEIIGHSVSILYPIDRRDELIDVMERIKRGQRVGLYETVRLRKDGHFIPVSVTVSPVQDASGKIAGGSAISRDITLRKRDEAERFRLIEELTESLKQVRTLSGLLPICASCKRIRDDQGYWQQVETYIAGHTNADFTQGICPDCLEKSKSGIKTAA
ncbi:MAG TPA: PAS domain S-box protein [Candidatus Limnocylindrales bacterium]|nr:PAS domain S-box protein [Candidatus Limnocylindrales bacterium]